MQYSEPTTTATSESEGRLKVDVGRCPHGKKKCLKCAMAKYGAKKDGKGGPGLLDAPGYGATKAQSQISFPKATTRKPHRASRVTGGVKLKGIKSLKMSKSKFGSLVKGSKSRSLKSILKNII